MVLERGEEKMGQEARQTGRRDPSRQYRFHVTSIVA